MTEYFLAEFFFPEFFFPRIFFVPRFFFVLVFKIGVRLHTQGCALYTGAPYTQRFTVAIMSGTLPLPAPHYYYTSCGTAVITALKHFKELGLAGIHLPHLGGVGKLEIDLLPKDIRVATGIRARTL